MRKIIVLPREGRQLSDEATACRECLTRAGIDVGGTNLLAEWGHGYFWIADKDERQALDELQKAGMQVVSEPLNCFRHNDPIKVGEQLIEIETNHGIEYAHDRCIPSCPRCHREILPDGPFSHARSKSTDRDGLPIVEHVTCPPH